MMPSYRSLACLFALTVMLTAPSSLRAQNASGKRLKIGEYNPAHESVEFFKAIDAGQLKVTFIPRDAKEARVLLENKTKKPLNVKLPDAFAGVPVLAQIGGMGGMGGGGMGGGMGGMGGMGGGGMGGGGGFFNVAPEQVQNFKVACVCLEHGKPDPTPRMKYEIRRVESYVDRPEVVEVLKMLGRGELHHSAAQAATWHLNNDMSWQELAAKTTGRRLLLSGEERYFSPLELHNAFRIVTAARQRAKSLEDSYSSASLSER